MAAFDPTWPPASVIIFPTLLSGSWIWQKQAAILAFLAPNFYQFPDAIANWNVPPTLLDLDAHVQLHLDSIPLPWLLVGCSLGGLLALRVALRKPEAVAAVIASGCPGLGRGGNLGSRTHFRPTFEGGRTAREILFTNPGIIDDDLVRKSIAVVASRSAVRRSTQLVRELNSYDGRSDVLNIKVPTLLIWGDDDRLSPPDKWRAAAQECKFARFNTVPKSGHISMLEASDAFNEILLSELSWVSALSVGRRSTR